MATVLNAGRGIRTFRILCKQAKHCGDNEDVARIVRDFLIVSVSQMSDFFWRSMPKCLLAIALDTQSMLLGDGSILHLFATNLIQKTNFTSTTSIIC